MKKRTIIGIIIVSAFEVFVLLILKDIYQVNTNLINKRTETIDNECAKMLMQKYGKIDPGLKQLCIDYVSKHVSQP